MNSRRSGQQAMWVEERALPERRGHDEPGDAPISASLRGQPMDRPGPHSVRGGSRDAAHLDAAISAPRVLLAHNATAVTCDALARLIEATGAELVDASSSDDARLAVEAEDFDACLVCLDLPPAPFAGVRLASELLERGCPVVLVTRSQRWLPADATALRALPWIPPDATEDALREALDTASGIQDSVVRRRTSLETSRVRLVRR
ncbi:hypothetical protein [Chondromyces crocatus]|uniref:Response regulatory domain-containing protein n=1 Tax=Chondromyces crocatus TaxID=52 RepID=A0A0K1EK00_CHOCO|nr:hypothetical protein [Chondromyces crocatus]AKT41007.1 uncharacterized protein CMC5_051650 [Chondromyces crocatus]